MRKPYREYRGDDDQYLRDRGWNCVDLGYGPDWAHPSFSGVYLTKDAVRMQRQMDEIK